MNCTKRIFQSAVVLALSLLSSVVFAQIPVVVSTTPSQNELNISASSDITVTFNIDMDASTINDSTFVVHALTTGSHSGTISYDSLPKQQLSQAITHLQKGKLLRPYLLQVLRVQLVILWAAVTFGHLQLR